jgi:hypothetical protein
MSNDLKTAIRKALAGSTSQQPVDTKTLLKLGKSDAIAVALEELLASREINTATVIKGGCQTTLCWLTGSVTLGNSHLRTPLSAARPLPSSERAGMTAPASDPYFAAVTRKIPPTQVKPTASITKQEKSDMNKHTNFGRTSPIRHSILELVGAQPGIDQEKLIIEAMKRTPGTEEKQARKAMQNLHYGAKLIRMQLTNEGLRSYYLSDVKAAKPAVAKAKLAKAKKVKAAKPVGAPRAAPAKPAQSTALAIKLDRTDKDVLHIMLAEDGCFHLSLGTSFLVLDAAQATRVHRFIGRFQVLEGASALKP